MRNVLDRCLKNYIIFAMEILSDMFALKVRNV